MDLSRRACDFWGLDHKAEPFGITPRSEASIFTWPQFEEAVDDLADVVLMRKFSILVGPACSAKSVLWATVVRRLRQEARGWTCCQPHSAELSKYNEINILHTVKEELMPDDGTREHSFKRDREGRARQVRMLLERENAGARPVTLMINDAHEASPRFLTLCKRMWDDLYGFDRLLSVILIGHPPLAKSISHMSEIAERLTTIYTPGLGDHLQAYVQHELARCGCQRWPFDDTAMEELARLQGPLDKSGNPSWLTRRDNPLIVSNVVSRAMAQAHMIKARTIGRDLISEAMREGQA